MATTLPPPNTFVGADLGDLLRHWRRVRRVSQLDLALAAGVSTRHISFVETGRSKASREMVLLLAQALDVPLRERNRFLHAAGFAAQFRETRLDDPQMSDMLRALRLILEQCGPLGGAVAFDRNWDIVMANVSYVRVVRLLLGDRAPALEPFALVPEPRPNILRLLFDPAGYRAHVVNWEHAAGTLLARVRQEALWSQDPATAALLQSLLAYPDVPAHWRDTGPERPTAFVTPIELRLPDCALRLFSTFTTLGTPVDITLQELRIESFHAADDDSHCALRTLLESS
jgi:transcriptional regulator with XRE-family HTH domain